MNMQRLIAPTLIGLAVLAAPTHAQLPFASLTEGGKASGNEGLTVINVMDFQREFDRALASTRGRRVLINILGEEGIAS